MCVEGKGATLLNIRISQREKSLVEQVRVPVGLFHAHTHSDSCLGAWLWLPANASHFRPEWVTPLSSMAGRLKIQFLAENPGNRLFPSSLPFSSGKGKVECREQVDLLHSSFLLLCQLKATAQIAQAQPLSSSFNVRKGEDGATLSYKGRINGTGNDLPSFGPSLLRTNISAHLPRNKGAYDHTATMLPAHLCKVH